MGRRWYAALLVVAGACGGEPEGPAAMVTDSAGVTVVTSVRPEWSSGEGWTVGGEPLLRIGVVDGRAAYQLSAVTGAVRLADGSVVVADGGSSEVRFFGPDGTVRAVIGGTGVGPGEFTGLSGLGRAPDGGVWAYDFPLRRITWLAPDGSVTGLTTLDAEPAVLTAVGALPDGSFVLRQLWGAREVAGARRTGLRRDPIAYVRVDTATAGVDTLGLFPGREVYLSDEGGRGVMSRPVFGRGSVAAVLDGRVVVGSQERFELEAYTPEGVPQRIIRLPTGELEVGPDDIDAYVDRYVAGVAPERRPGLRAMLERMPSPDTRPAYGELMADAVGTLWVSDWAVVPTEAPDRWTVLDDEGRWLGAVEMPDGFYPLDAGEDWIVGVERDDMDVEQVVVYPLDRGVGS